MVGGDISFTVFCLLVYQSHLSVTLSMKSTTISRRQPETGCQKGTKFGTLLVRPLLYISEEIDELPRGSRGLPE